MIPITVKILDKEFLVSCPEDEEISLRSSAQYLDRKMREVRDSGKIVGLDRIAVMVALNITHDLLNNKDLNNDLNQSVSGRVKNIQEKVELALHKGKQMELLLVSTRFFSSLPDLKEGSFFGLTTTGSPVFGLRPVYDL